MGCRICQLRRRATCADEHTSELRQSRPPAKPLPIRVSTIWPRLAVLLALRICESYSTRLAPCIRGHLVRNAAHEGFCISLLGSLRLHVAYGRHEPRLRDELAADARPGRELEHAAHDVELYRLEDELVAGKHRPLEARI